MNEDRDFITVEELGDFMDFSGRGDFSARCDQLEMFPQMFDGGN